MNGNLFKIVLVSVVAILLAIIGGIMSADGDPLSIVLAVSPFILAALFLMKEKVWYLWMWIPAFFCFSGSFSTYIPLCAYGIVLPFTCGISCLKEPLSYGIPLDYRTFSYFFYSFM